MSHIPKNRIKQIIIRELLSKNAEYHNNHSAMGSKVWPKLVFKEYGYPQYFKPGIKQKWVRA